jgi:hypothetical protein
MQEMSHLLERSANSSSITECMNTRDISRDVLDEGLEFNDLD